MLLYVSERFADMAQEAAHFLGKEEVAGSNPAISSRSSRDIARELFLLYN